MTTQWQEITIINGEEIDLHLVKTVPGNPTKNWVPAYHFNMALKGSDTPIGVIDLRIGHNENLYYGGHIGYAVHSEHRGHHYAGKAVLLLKELALAHGMEKVTITCNPDNLPSRKTCEYVGAELKGIVTVPPHNDLYQRGEKEKCIYELVW